MADDVIEVRPIPVLTKSAIFLDVEQGIVLKAFVSVPIYSHTLVWVSQLGVLHASVKTIVDVSLVVDAVARKDYLVEHC